MPKGFQGFQKGNQLGKRFQKGIPLPEEYRKKLIGNKNLLGSIRSKETRKKDSERQKGKNNSNYKDGRSQDEAYSKWYQKLWREKNPEKLKKWGKEWRKKNPEKLRMKSRNRRARSKNAKGFFTIKEWEELKKKYNYMCLCCKKQEPEINLTPDHIIPLSRGGSNWIKNIQPLCLKCNLHKFTKTINYGKFGTFN